MPLSVRRCVPLGAGRRRTLNVHTPLLGVETESLERALLAQTLRGIDMFISTVVTSTGVSLGVFVWLRLARAYRCGVRLESILCITLPSASRTACEVKFSEGIRLIKCF